MNCIAFSFAFDRALPTLHLGNHAQHRAPSPHDPPARFLSSGAHSHLICLTSKRKFQAFGRTKQPPHILLVVVAGAGAPNGDQVWSAQGQRSVQIQKGLGQTGDTDVNANANANIRGNVMVRRKHGKSQIAMEEDHENQEEERDQRFSEIQDKDSDYDEGQDDQDDDVELQDEDEGSHDDDEDYIDEEEEEQENDIDKEYSEVEASLLAFVEKDSTSKRDYDMESTDDVILIKEKKQKDRYEKDKSQSFEINDENEDQVSPLIKLDQIYRSESLADLRSYVEKCVPDNMKYEDEHTRLIHLEILKRAVSLLLNKNDNRKHNIRNLQNEFGDDDDDDLDFNDDDEFQTAEVDEKDLKRKVEEIDVLESAFTLLTRYTEIINSSPNMQAYGSKKSRNEIYKTFLRRCKHDSDVYRADRVVNFMLDQSIALDRYCAFEYFGALMHGKVVDRAIRVLRTTIQIDVEEEERTVERKMLTPMNDWDPGRVRGIWRNSWMGKAWIWNWVLREYGREGNLDAAFGWIDEMHKYGIQPDVVTFNTLLDTTTQTKDWNMIDTIMNRMASAQVKPDLHTYNTLMKCYSRAQKWKKVELVFSEIKSQLFPSQVTYNTMLNAYCAQGDMDAAAICFEEMTSKGIEPNGITFTTLVKGFGRAGNGKRAVELLDALRESGFSLDQRTYYTVINASILNNNTKQALDLIHRMQGDGYVVDTSTIIWLINIALIIEDQDSAIGGLNIIIEEDREFEEDDADRFLEKASNNTNLLLFRLFLEDNFYELDEEDDDG